MNTDFHIISEILSITEHDSTLRELLPAIDLGKAKRYKKWMDGDEASRADRKKNYRRIFRWSGTVAKSNNESIFSGAYLADNYLYNANRLLRKGKTESAIGLIQRGLEVALRYEVLDTAIECCLLLCDVLANDPGKEKQFEAYYKLSEQIEEGQKIFTAVNSIYYTISAFMISKTRRTKKLPQDLLTKSQWAKEAANPLQLNKITLYKYRIGYYTNIMLGDLTEAFNICQTAMRSLNTKHPDTPVAMGFILNSITEIHVKRGEFEAAEKCAYRILSEKLYRNEPGDLNTYLRILIHMGKGEYDKSAGILTLLDPVELARKHTEESAKSFEFMRAYHFVLDRMGYLSPEADYQGIRNFRFSRWLNDIVKFERDKQGYNVHVYILKLLYAASQQNFDYIIDQEESIDKYIRRYLRSKEQTRNRTLLKLMLSVLRYDFNRAKIEREEADQIQKMYAMVNQACARDRTLHEFIPYPDVWQIYLKALCGGLTEL